MSQGALPYCVLYIIAGFPPPANVPDGLRRDYRFFYNVRLIIALFKKFLVRSRFVCYNPSLSPKKRRNPDGIGVFTKKHQNNMSVRRTKDQKTDIFDPRDRRSPRVYSLRGKSRRKVFRINLISSEATLTILKYSSDICSTFQFNNAFDRR